MVEKYLQDTPMSNVLYGLCLMYFYMHVVSVHCDTFH